MSAIRIHPLLIGLLVSWIALLFTATALREVRQDLSIAQRNLSLLRHRADRLLWVRVIDRTRILKPPAEVPGATHITLESAAWYVPEEWLETPVLAVDSWSSSGLIGAPLEPGQTQWLCSEGYTLKFDEDLPYCEKNRPDVAKEKP